MRKIIVLTVVGLVLAVTASAGVFTVGPYVTWRTGHDADATAGPDLAGYVGLSERLTLELAYAPSGEGVKQTLTRFGAHWRIASIDEFEFTLGGGLAIKALGAEFTERGGFLSAGLQGDLPTFGEWRFGVDLNGKFSRDPKPHFTLRSAKVFRF